LGTIFDKIINKEIPAEIVYETDRVLAFKDINPVAPIHLLIIPKYNIQTVNDVTEDDSEVLAELFLSAKELSKKMGIDKEGYRLVINCNDNGGQTVYHLHMHLIAGQKLGWPPG
jgi:histidine triad (HIT) family protein